MVVSLTSQKCLLAEIDWKIIIKSIAIPNATFGDCLHLLISKISFVLVGEARHEHHLGVANINET